MKHDWVTIITDVSARLSPSFHTDRVLAVNGILFCTVVASLDSNYARRPVAI